MSDTKAIRALKASIKSWDERRDSNGFGIPSADTCALCQAFDDGTEANLGCIHACPLHNSCIEQVQAEMDKRGIEESTQLAYIHCGSMITVLERALKKELRKQKTRRERKAKQKINVTGTV